MSTRSTTPAELARRKQCETDDILILLWDAGILYPTGPNSQIRPQDVSRADQACGLVGPKEKTQVSYWMRLTELDRPALQEHMRSLGISLGDNARRLPKGALAKLEKHASNAFSVSEIPPARPTREPTATQPAERAFVWRAIGHTKSAMDYLSTDEVESVHFEIAADFQYSADPISPAGVRDPHLLASAVTRPETSLGDHRKYPTVELAAAALMHSLVHNHAFYNGNKRTALVSVLSFLDRNGYMLQCSQDDLFRWTVRVAQHGLKTSNRLGDRSDMEVAEMAEWILENARPIGRGERVVTFKVLRRLLAGHNCTVTPSGNRGGRMIITRDVTDTRQTVFGARQSVREAKYVIPYGGDGRQVSRQHIKELRRDLHLSDEYGFDSDSFYGQQSAPIDQFIATYRKTLARLAKI